MRLRSWAVVNSCSDQFTVQRCSMHLVANHDRWRPSAQSAPCTHQYGEPTFTLSTAVRATWLLPWPCNPLIKSMQVWFHSKHSSILQQYSNLQALTDLMIQYWLDHPRFLCCAPVGCLFISSLRQLNRVLKAQRVQSSLAPQECVEESRDQCLDLSQALKKSCSQPLLWMFGSNYTPYRFHYVLSYSCVEMPYGVLWVEGCKLPSRAVTHIWYITIIPYFDRNIYSCIYSLICSFNISASILKKCMALHGLTLPYPEHFLQVLVLAHFKPVALPRHPCHPCHPCHLHSMRPACHIMPCRCAVNSNKPRRHWDARPQGVSLSHGSNQPLEQDESCRKDLKSSPEATKITKKLHAARSAWYERISAHAGKLEKLNSHCEACAKQNRSALTPRWHDAFRFFSALEASVLCRFIWYYTAAQCTRSSFTTYCLLSQEWLYPCHLARHW